MSEGGIIRTIFKYLGFVTTATFYASPCVLIYNLIYGRVKVEYTSFAMIVIGLFHAVIWFTFGILRQRDLEIWSNFIGSVLSFIWLIIYLYFYSGKDTVRYSLYLLTLIDLIFELGFIEYDFLYSNCLGEKTREDILRGIASALNVLMYITPGLNILKFFQTWNYKYICGPVAIAGALQNIVWIIIGALGDVDNSFKVYWEKIIANSVSLIITGFQAFFYLKHYNDTVPELEEEEAAKAEKAALIPEKEKEGKHEKKSADVDQAMFDYL